MINEVVIVLSVVERVQCEAVEEGAFIFGLTDYEWDFGEFTLNQQVFGSVGKHVAINIGSEPSWEGEEHEHGVGGFDQILLGLTAQAEKEGYRVMLSPDGVKDDTHYFKTDETKTKLFSSG